ncbi:MAG TPA: hypothetical protein VN260_01860, partial [Dissulfurispiraceae bacterium]|nr:hypothetical protein [Dissulfurispiraceae bacterium]
MKTRARSSAARHAVLSIAVLTTFLALLPVIAQGQTIGQSSRLAASAAGGSLEIVADLTGAEVISIDIAGAGIGIVHTESKESPVFLSTMEFPDASYRFEVQLVDAAGNVVDRLAGVFTVRNGQVIVPVQKRDGRAGSLLPGLAETLKIVAEAVRGFVFSEAEAADLTVSDAGSADLFIDVTNVGAGADWDVNAVGCNLGSLGTCFDIWSYGVAGYAMRFADSPNVIRSFLVDGEGDIHFANDGMVFDRANVRLGIGMTTPGYRLDVVGDRIRLRNNTTATARTIALRNDGIATDLEALNADLWIRADLPAPAHNIYMLSNRIGVGTTTPLYKFTVSGEGSDRSTLHFTNTGTDVGGWLTSVADNNFFVSSGA